MLPNIAMYFYNSIKHQSFVLHTFKLSNSSISSNSISHKSFVCTQFKCQTVLMSPLIGPYQVLSLQARVGLWVMATKGYSVFPKAPSLLEPHHQIVLCHIHSMGESYLSVEMQSVYSKAPLLIEQVRKGWPRVIWHKLNL